jgi:lipoprotein signal peptidase
MLVAAADLLAKLVATGALAGRAIPVIGPVDLTLVYNRGSAFGVSLGANTWQLNVVTTFAALVLVTLTVRALTLHDPRAPIALGLIGGAALGNLTSLLVPPAGVADFISVAVGADTRIVMNLADIAAYAGLALIVRTALRVHGAIAATRVRPSATRHHEVEVPIFVAAEPAVRAVSRTSGAVQPRVSHTPDNHRQVPRAD